MAGGRFTGMATDPALTGLAVSAALVSTVGAVGDANKHSNAEAAVRGRLASAAKRSGMSPDRIMSVYGVTAASSASTEQLMASAGNLDRVTSDLNNQDTTTAQQAAAATRKNTGPSV